VDHDDLVRTAVAVAVAADRRAIEQAWLASLVTRDQSRRSVWPRLTFLRHLPQHGFVPSQHFHPTNCGVCGMRESEDAVTSECLASDAFWFRPIDIPWASAAVERFDGADDDHDVHRGRAVLEDIVDAIRSLPQSAQLTELNAALIGKLKSNKLERTVLLEALGYTGALPAAGYPSYATEFVSYDDANSRMPSQFYKKEWAYPVRFWTGVDGVDPARLPTGE
jgi:hypothetical protein